MKHFHTEREKNERHRDRLKKKEKTKDREMGGNDIDFGCYLSNHQNQKALACQRIKFRY